MTFEWQNIPLGTLCLPGLRWILRIHHLDDDENTRYLLREYILSAWNVAGKFSDFLDRDPAAGLWLFSTGSSSLKRLRVTLPKSADLESSHMRWDYNLPPRISPKAKRRRIPIHIPDEFELNDEQNAKLDAYLAKRFQGDFTMAGIKFWADMKGLDESFLKKAAGFKQIVPIFTNVIFDTSQPHANTVFEDMFQWLDLVLDVIKLHRETLFVIRAHPDELRVRKSSRETVQGWVAQP